jgi:hypothetical protein
MPIQPERLLNHRFEDLAQTYAPRDAILYALGVGLGRDPCDRDDLAYLLETGLQILPTFAVTLASPGMWIAAPEFGVDFAKLVHAEQAASFHVPLPPTADVVARAQVISLTAARDAAPSWCWSAAFAMRRAGRTTARSDRRCGCAATAVLAAHGICPRPPSFLIARPNDARARR